MSRTWVAVWAVGGVLAAWPLESHAGGPPVLQIQAPSWERAWPWWQGAHQWLSPNGHADSGRMDLWRPYATSHEPAAVILYPEGVWLWSLGLHDPAAFDATAETQSEARLSLEPGISVHVLDSERPLACGRKGQRMACQMGVSTTGIRPLHRHLEQAHAPARGVQGWFRPAEARQVVEALAVADARRRSKILASAARTSLVRQAQLAARDRTRGWDRVRKVAWQEISPRRMQVDAEFTDRGQRWLDSQLSEASLPPDWQKWAASKALAGGWVQLSSDAVRRWFEAFPRLRAASFRGGVAGLVLGVDGGCPLDAEDPERWRYAWPTVLAAPLVRTPTTGLWWGEHGGAPYALHLDPRGVWVGTGRGSGGAARRLWQGLPLEAPDPVSADTIAAFRVDLGAMRSAVQAAALGRTKEGQVARLLDRIESLLPGVEVATVEVVRPSPRQLRAHLTFDP